MLIYDEALTRLKNEFQKRLIVIRRQEELIKSFRKYPTILTMQFVMQDGTCYFTTFIIKPNLKYNLKKQIADWKEMIQTGRFLLK
jgi:hypothetical protein